MCQQQATPAARQPLGQNDGPAGDGEAGGCVGCVVGCVVRLAVSLSLFSFLLSLFSFLSFFPSLLDSRLFAYIPVTSRPLFPNSSCSTVILPPPPVPTTRRSRCFNHQHRRAQQTQDAAGAVGAGGRNDVLALSCFGMRWEG